LRKGKRAAILLPDEAMDVTDESLAAPSAGSLNFLRLRFSHSSRTNKKCSLRIKTSAAQSALGQSYHLTGTRDTNQSLHDLNANVNVKNSDSLFKNRGKCKLLINADLLNC
jgi:hypothetical protein